MRLQPRKNKTVPGREKTKAQSRVPVTALMAWPRFDSEKSGTKGAKQMAAPAVTRTPNMHRAKTNRSSRVRMEAWRQRLLGGTTKTRFNEASEESTRLRPAFSWKAITLVK